jgi:Nucleotidyl transferase AbiEii toxin, Type IV TA system
MENRVIPEPQRTYVLELLHALGPAADEFVVAGAQAMKFIVERARATKDIDFILDVVRLRGEPIALGAQLERLGYAAVDGSRNFQFEKPIPNSRETMRIEFMAPEEFKRGGRDFRVDVQKGVHARACTGGTIAVAESEIHQLAGRLPNGSKFAASLRVTKPHALVMMKLLALDDRYRNIRGPAEARHDREEARTHAADVAAIVSAQRDLAQFKEGFQRQFEADPTLRVHVSRILDEYFRENISPGLLVYEEFLVADRPSLDREARREIQQEIKRVHQLIRILLPT